MALFRFGRYCGVAKVLCSAQIGHCRGSLSVFDFVGRCDPGSKAGPSFLCKELRLGERTLGAGFFHFAVKESIIETGAGRVSRGAAVVDGVETRPVRCGEAHGTGLATGVQLTAFERERAECLAGRANGVDFAVGRGIVDGGNTVGTFTDDNAVAYDDGGEGSPFAVDDILSGESDGPPKELWIW